MSELWYSMYSIKQSRFNTMTDSLLSRIDDMGERIDELEKRYV